MSKKSRVKNQPPEIVMPEDGSFAATSPISQTEMQEAIQAGLVIASVIAASAKMFQETLQAIINRRASPSPTKGANPFEPGGKYNPTKKFLVKE